MISAIWPHRISEEERATQQKQCIYRLCETFRSTCTGVFRVAQIMTGPTKHWKASETALQRINGLTESSLSPERTHSYLEASLETKSSKKTWTMSIWTTTQGKNSSKNHVVRRTKVPQEHDSMTLETIMPLWRHVKKQTTKKTMRTRAKTW